MEKKGGTILSYFYRELTLGDPAQTQAIYVNRFMGNLIKGPLKSERNRGAMGIGGANCRGGHQGQPNRGKGRLIFVGEKAPWGGSIDGGGG